jgi:hypothetical protein
VLAPAELTSFAYIAAFVLLGGEMVRAIGIYGVKDNSLRKKYLALVLRSAFAFVVWLISFFPQRIRWREQQFRVRDKRLVPIAPRQLP